MTLEELAELPPIAQAWNTLFLGYRYLSAFIEQHGVAWLDDAQLNALIQFSEIALDDLPLIERAIIAEAERLGVPAVLP